ncbi:MAG TPA: alanine racemase, partial [Stellaceae bacterium]|nr:alanine racemase [Stellaceae bacterium]
MSVAIACPSNTDAPAVPAGSGGYVTVDLAAIVENWRRIGRIVGPGCTVAAVVKADAYGLGMAPVAQALARAGCRWFFVAPVEEGLALVEALDPDLSGLRIGVLSGPSVECLVAPSLVPVINDLGQLEAWRVMAPGRPAILNLDTGMARLGMPVSEAAHLAADPALLDGVPVAAVMSHLACPDQHDHPMNER